MDRVGDSKVHQRVQQQPMLAGFKSVVVSRKEAESIINDFSDSKLKESSIYSRTIGNANELKKHDAALKRWNDNVETARAMCEEVPDKSVNDQLKTAIERNNGAENNITFDENKGVFFYKNGNPAAKFKVIQGCNGKHLLQITISGRLSPEKLEERIEEVVSELGKYCEIEDFAGKRTLNLNDTEIILPSKMNHGQRVSFELEHNRIHFHDDKYKKDMENVFGKNNVPFNASGSFPVKEKTSDDIWRDQCMRHVKSMISPTVNIVKEDGESENDSTASIKAPVSCYLNLLSMNIMLNSILNNYINSGDSDGPIVAYDRSIVSIAGNLSVVINDGEKDPFQSWINTLNSVHQAYDEYICRIADLRNKHKRESESFVAEEAILRQHEALLRELFVEATNRAEEVLELDMSSEISNISLLDREEISDMEFSDASNVMSNVIQMFVQKHADGQRALELKKEEEERRAQAEEAQDKISGLEKEMLKLNEALKERNEKIAELEKNIESLKKQIEDLSKNAVQKATGDNRVDSMNVNSVNYVNDVYGMQPVSDDMKKKMEELRSEYNELKKKCEEQQMTIKRLEDEIARLRRDLNGLEAERDEWERKYEEQDQKLIEMEGKIKEYHEAVQGLERIPAETDSVLSRSKAVNHVDDLPEDLFKW